MLELLGGLANIAPVCNNIKRLNEGLIKKIESGEPLTFHPKYRKAFSASPTAKARVATNVLPELGDTSERMRRRLKILPFARALPAVD